MPRLLHLLDRGSLGLIVSLPDNDPELARSAVLGGADALKVHIGLRHEASGTIFGSFQEERARILSVMDVAPGIPLGVAIGPDAGLTPSDYHELSHGGISFLDAFPRHLPAWIRDEGGPDLLLALDKDAAPYDLGGLARFGRIAVELAIIPEDGYGLPLTLEDVFRYSCFRSAIRQPIVVPTQRHIEPRDLAALARVGVDGVMIGAVVTGATAGGIEDATRSFRTAIDDINAGGRLPSD